jgi:hypothetical protein
MRLDEAIAHHFDATGRAALAAGLGVEWAELPGEKAAAQAAALVTALGEQGRSADLLAALAEASPNVSWAALPYPRETLNHLHAALVRRHNIDGLRSVCFRLGIDFDDLPGEGKDGRARELVLALDRQGRVGELWGSDEFRKKKLTQRTPSAPRAQKENLTQRRKDAKKSLSYLALLASLRELLASFMSRISRLSSLATRHLPLATRRLPPAARHLPLVLFLLLLLAVGWRMTAGRGQATADITPTAIAGQLMEVASPAATAAETPARAWRPRPATPKAVVAAALDELVGTPTAVPTPAPTSLLAEPTATPTAAPTAKTLIEVGARGANLRRGPGPQFDVVATLRAGVLLEAVGISPSGEWIQLRVPGKGWPWIDARFALVPEGATLPTVMTVASAATVPVTTPFPEPATPSPVATTVATPVTSWPPYTPPNPPLPPTPIPTRTPWPTSGPPPWLITPTSPPP